jgi:phospholipid/cholesterol/gamma-HCH transport system ATP-binding protein
VTAGDRDAFLARFGMLFQGGALFDSMPVWQNVAFRLLRGRQAPQGRGARDRHRETAPRGAGPDVADLYPAELSGGMQKRAASRAPSPPSPRSSSSTSPPPASTRSWRA